MRKGERRAGVGTGALERSLGEERNESVKSKYIVHVSEWHAIVTSCHGSPNLNIWEAPCRAMVI